MFSFVPRCPRFFPKTLHQRLSRQLRLDAWMTNAALQRYYLRQGFQHVRTVREGGAVNGGPRVSGWLAQRATAPADHDFEDDTA